MWPLKSGQVLPIAKLAPHLHKIFTVVFYVTYFVNGVHIMDPKTSVFIFSKTTDCTMITFITLKVSDRHFKTTLKSKTCLRHVVQTFPFLFIITINLLLYIFLFDFVLQYHK